MCCYVICFLTVKSFVLWSDIEASFIWMSRVFPINFIAIFRVFFLNLIEFDWICFDFPLRAGSVEGTRYPLSEDAAKEDNALADSPEAEDITALIQVRSEIVTGSRGGAGHWSDHWSVCSCDAPNVALTYGRWSALCLCFSLIGGLAVWWCLPLLMIIGTWNWIWWWNVIDVSRNLCVCMLHLFHVACW